jgi:hypothetical protein
MPQLKINPVKSSFEEVLGAITSIPEKREKEKYKQFITMLADKGFTLKEFEAKYKENYWRGPNMAFNRNKITPKPKGII